MIITKKKNKPPQWFLERSDDNGVMLQAALIKGPKGGKSWNLLLEGGGEHLFRTRKAALRFFGALQHM